MKRIVLYGGRGNLGSMCVNHFKAANWWVANIDLGKNEHADANIIVTEDFTWMQQEQHVMQELSSILDSKKVNTVAGVAGGWSGGKVDNFSRQANLTWKQSVWTSSIAGMVAAKYLAPGGLLAFTGAQVALSGTPGMIGYGMAKAAVHQLTKFLGAREFGLSQNSVAVAILPITLDTPMNRKWMPNAEFSSWTPLSFVAELLMMWSRGKDRPPSGSLVSLVTKNNVTTLVLEDKLYCEVAKNKSDLNFA